MTFIRWILLAFAVAAQPLAAQVTARAVDAPATAEAPPDLSGHDERALRRIVVDMSRPVSLREQARRELAGRFPSARTTALLMNAEAIALADAFEGERAYALFTRVRSLYAGSSEPGVNREVARAIRGQAQALGVIEAANSNESLVPLGPHDIDFNSPPLRLRQELVDTFSDDPDPEIRLIVFQERYNLEIARGIAAGTLGDPQRLYALIADYDDLEGERDDSFVAHILFAIATAESDPRRAIAAYDEVIRRFAASAGDRLRSRIVDAYENKAFLLEQLGDTAAAARAREAEYAWFERTRLTED